MSMTDHQISRCSTIHNLNKTFQQNKYFQKKSRQQCLALMLTTSHLPCSGPLVVLMLEEVGSQKHRLDISLELIASLEDTLESCVSLVSMPCVKNLVVGVYPGLQRFQLEATHSIYTNLRMGNFRVLKKPVFCSRWSEQPALSPAWTQKSWRQLPLCWDQQK